MMKTLHFALLTTLITVSCSSLPNPNMQPGKPSAAAVELLQKSAAKAGNPWKTLQRVEVGFDGEWTRIVKKIQPDLVNADFRKTSKEIYSPSMQRVEQTHKGPGGIKQVLRAPGRIEVRFNSQLSTNETEKDAAALVADAYTMFVFGADYLLARGKDWRLWLGMQRQAIGDDPCHLIFGTLKPGVGRSAEDKVIAWVSQRDQRLRRVQFTLNGLASTGGADVDVTFSDYQQGPRGTEWPKHFLETVRRPLTVKAHEWRMTELKAR